MESTTRPANGRPPRADLDGLRRLVWASSVGLVVVTGLFVVVAVVVTETPSPSMVAVAVAAVAVTAAAALLVQRRLRTTTATTSDASTSAATSTAGTASRMAAVVVAAVGALVATAAAQSAPGDPAWGLVPGLGVGGIAVTVPRRLRSWVVAAGALVATGTAAMANPDGIAVATLAADGAVVALLAGALVATAWSWDVVERLERARRTEGELAVAQERLRFAADLHDVQGHHLEVIAMHSELATRLAARDPAAAASHMELVHDHARKAMDDTRAVVEGHRRTPLRTELANAVRVLDAAGVDARLTPATEHAAEAVPDHVRGLLGLVVREATTNVLRHSDATRVRLACRHDDDLATIRISNDCVREDDHEPGSGLTTLAGRLRRAGGTLDWEVADDSFTVEATVPMVAA